MTIIDPSHRKVILSVQRALRGQTPKSLRALSFDIEKETNIILLKAHFGLPPTEADLDAISVAAAEIDADFLDHLETRTIFEVTPTEVALSILPGGIAYLRAGE